MIYVLFEYSAIDDAESVIAASDDPQKLKDHAETERPGVAWSENGGELVGKWPGGGTDSYSIRKVPHLL